MKKLALIADIVRSREVKDRALLQNQLSEVLKRLNASTSGLVSPYTITLGDEFQGLFDHADEIFRNALLIMSELYPVQVRFAIGVGEITTTINTEQALGMDGPAFYAAREAMDYLKDQGGCFCIRGLTEPPQSLCNNSLALMSAVVEKWRQSRFQVLVGLMDHKAVKSMVEPLGLSDKAIYKNISDGALEPIHGLLADLSKQLNLAMGV